MNSPNRNRTPESFFHTEWKASINKLNKNSHRGEVKSTYHSNIFRRKSLKNGVIRRDDYNDSAKA